MVLSPELRGDVCGEAGEEGDAVKTGVGGGAYGQTAEDFEAVAGVQFGGDGAEFWMEGGEREGGLGDVAEGLVEGFATSLPAVLHILIFVKAYT